MDDSYERDEASPPRTQAEGVRIIRAEEAQAALDAGHAAGRRPDDAPRFGDVPAPPSGPRSPHRFPLPDSVDPASAVPRPAVRVPERRFGGRLTNRAKAPETLRSPAPPRVVRLVPPESDDRDAVAPEPLGSGNDLGWDDGDGWTEETIPRPTNAASPLGAPLSAAVPTKGPKHFAKDPSPGAAAARPASSTASGADWLPAGTDSAWPGDPVAASVSADSSYGSMSAAPGSGGWSGSSGSSGSSGYGASPPDTSTYGAGVGAHGSAGATVRIDPGYDIPPPPVRGSAGYDPSAPPPVPAALPPPDLALPEEGINVHSGSMPALQHWTDPPTGEVPFIRADREPSEGGEMAAWQALGSRGLRWRDEASDWDDLEDVSELGDDETRLGALDTSRTEHSDMFSFDEQFDRLEDERSAPAPVLDPLMDAPPVSAAMPSGRTAPRSRPPLSGARTTRRIDSGTGGPPGNGGSSLGPPSGGNVDRDLRAATAVGVGMLVVLCVAYILGAAVLVVLASAIVTASALELYNLIQHRGFRPATLLGVAATLAAMLAGYWRGEIAIPLILVLVFVTSMLWYMVGVVDARPVVNVGLTVMAFVWVGVFGSYASLLLRAPHGKQLLLLPILVTVAADVAAFFAGRTIGSRPLSPTISPGKTWEGVIGGGLGAIIMSFLLSRLSFLSKTWTGQHALILGVVIAIVAPLGDLCESMVKRDLELKDSGSLLPGHGGLLDRFDAVLFVLPATYYLLVYLKLVV